MKIFWERVQGFFVPIHLIPGSHVLDIYECLGFKGEKDDILVSHCLLLARYYYIYCCKFKSISPSIREYVQQLKYNLEIEKKNLILPLLIPRINSSRSGTKYFVHYIALYCYIVCGQVPNVSLLTGYILYQSPYPDLNPLKIKIARCCTLGFFLPKLLPLSTPPIFQPFVFCNC